MQLNLLEIAQKLIDDLLVEEEKNRHRAEGVAMLFHKIQEVHAAAQRTETSTSEVEPDTTHVER